MGTSEKKFICVLVVGFLILFSVVVLAVHLSSQEDSALNTSLERERKLVTALTFGSNIEQFFREQPGKFDVNEPLMNGTTTPLHLAAGLGNTKAVKYLLDAGANVNAVDAIGQTALHSACQGVLGCNSIKLLIKRGANVNARDREENTPLHFAVYSLSAKECSEAVRDLLAADADVTLHTKDGNTPLHLACMLNNSIPVRAIVLAGADVNAVNHELWTPLHVAAQYQADTVIPILLESKADHSLLTKTGWSALALAINAENDPIREALQKAGAKEESWNDLFLAVIFGNAESVKKELDKGADVNSRDRCGRTPLIWAAARSKEKIVDLLVKHNADANAKDSNQETALHQAAQAFSLKNLDSLIASKADPNTLDANGRTPLHEAVATGNVAYVEKLLSAGAEVNLVSRDGDTPLTIAVNIASQAWNKTDAEEIVSMLLEKGADVSLAKISDNTFDRNLFSAGDKIKEMIKTRSVSSDAKKLEIILERYSDKNASEKYDPNGIIAATPKDLLRKMMHAMYLGDHDSYVDCFRDIPKERELARNMAECITEVLEFRKRIIERYGKTGWADFLNAGKANLEITIIDESDIEACKVDINGDRAAFTGLYVPGFSQLKLVKQGDIWQVDAKSSLPPGADPDGLGLVVKTMRQAVKNVQSDIAKPDMTLQVLNEKMNREIMKLVFGISIKD